MLTLKITFSGENKEIYQIFIFLKTPLKIIFKIKIVFFDKNLHFEFLLAVKGRFLWEIIV